MRRAEHLRDVVDHINRSGGIYHQIDLGSGLVVKGEYDMTRYIDFYGIPAGLGGRTVLDIGTSSGFFAPECARRGASVTAIDIWEGRVFNTLKKALGLSAHYLQRSIYDLDGSFGRFDIVICRSLLLHLPDVLGTLQRISSVSADIAIIATAFLDDEACRESSSYRICRPDRQKWPRFRIWDVLVDEPSRSTTHAVSGWILPSSGSIEVLTCVGTWKE
jgi:SAM-dependent methyltransferase